MEKLYTKVFILSILIASILNAHARIIKISGLSSPDLSNIQVSVFDDPSVAYAHDIIFNPEQSADNLYILNSKWNNSATNYLTKVSNLNDNNPVFAKIYSSNIFKPQQLIFDPSSDGDSAYINNNCYYKPCANLVLATGLNSEQPIFTPINGFRYTKFILPPNSSGDMLYAIRNNYTYIDQLKNLKYTYPEPAMPTFKAEKLTDLAFHPNGNGDTAYLLFNDKITKIASLKTDPLHLEQQTIYNNIYNNYLTSLVFDDKDDNAIYVTYESSFVYGGIVKISNINNINKQHNSQAKNITTNIYYGYKSLFALDPTNTDTGYRLDYNWDLVKMTNLKNSDRSKSGVKHQLVLKNLANSEGNPFIAQKLIFDPKNNGDVIYVVDWRYE